MASLRELLEEGFAFMPVRHAATEFSQFQRMVFELTPLNEAQQDLLMGALFGAILLRAMKVILYG